MERIPRSDAALRRKHRLIAPKVCSVTPILIRPRYRRDRENNISFVPATGLLKRTSQDTHESGWVQSIRDHVQRYLRTAENCMYHKAQNLLSRSS